MLGHKFWGGAWVIVLIALFNSAIAVAIACTNSATRFLYGMARTGVLPHRLTDDPPPLPHADRRRSRCRP